MEILLGFMDVPGLENRSENVWGTLPPPAKCERWIQDKPPNDQRLTVGWTWFILVLFKTIQKGIGVSFNNK